MDELHWVLNEFRKGKPIDSDRRITEDKLLLPMLWNYQSREWLEILKQQQQQATKDWSVL